MSVLAEWRAARDRRQRATSYLQSLLPEPSAHESSWLQSIALMSASPLPSIASNAAPADIPREIMFARWAIALMVAERDALDDRTAADVAHLLADAVRHRTRQTPEIGRQWAERWRAYSAAVSERGMAEPLPSRLARVLLGCAGVATPEPEQLKTTTRWFVETRSRANEVLRDAFGAASLPDDVKPSALLAERESGQKRI